MKPISIPTHRLLLARYVILSFIQGENYAQNSSRQLAKKLFSGEFSPQFIVIRYSKKLTAILIVFVCAVVISELVRSKYTPLPVARAAG